MASRYEIFDNEQVHFETRKQAGRLSALVVAAVVTTLALIALAFTGYVPTAFSLLLVGTAWIALAAWIGYRMRLLRRVVWCLKISDQRIVGYDYLRKPTVFDWTIIERIELGPRSLHVHAGPDRALDIPQVFGDFHMLSHCLMHWADFYGTPLYINGRRWQDTSVYDLYPFLAESANDDP